MEMGRWARFGWFGILVATSIGCASSGSIRSVRAPTQAFDRETPITVEVSAVDRDAGGYVMVLRDAIDQKLAIQGLRMSQPGTPGAVEISAAITEIRRVSRASRTVFGSFAGQAGITVSVTLVEASSERVIGSFVAEGKSSAGTIFAGTTDQAVDQVATQIANYIMRTRSGG